MPILVKRFPADRCDPCYGETTGYTGKDQRLSDLREADGLALSSRNVRLTPEQRQKAPLIARTLKESTNFVPEKSVQEVIDYVVNTINADPIMRVEYYEIVDGNTMESIKNWSDTTYPVGCITVYCGEVRLIDNIKY